MSFFVSDSLKGLITEEDLEADSPIKIVEEKETISIRIQDVEFELLSIDFSKDTDEIIVITSKIGLSKIFECVNKKVHYSILLCENNYLENSGTLFLEKLEVNKEDNYIICKIDIFKRG